MIKASRYAAAAIAILATGCTTQSGQGTGAEWLQLGEALTRPGTATPPTDDRLMEDEASPEREGRVERRVVPYINPGSQTPLPGGESPELPTGTVNVTLPPQPLPNFINTVFGEILEQPFSMGPSVAENQALISLRSVREMEAATFLSLVEEALKDYGVGVIYEDGLYRLVEVSELRARMPRFVNARARAEVPSGLRPVIQFVQLTAINAGDMQTILEQAFPDRSQLTIRSTPLTNSLVISGLADDVNAAMAIVDEMDELRQAGRQVITYSPTSWEASELAQSIQEILTLEGFSIGVGVSAPRALTLLPLDFTNQLMIFAPERSQATYVLSLAQQLDREAYRGEAQAAHVYDVQNAEAETLAGIVSAVVSGRGNAGSAGAAAEGGGEDGQAASGPANTGDLTVDQEGNRIIFYGTYEEYDAIESLLRRLDTPIPEVLIEVTIAEVTLTDGSSYGLDLVFDSEIAPGFAATLNSSGGFSAVVDTGQVTIDGQASADNNQINVLSTPRVVTRSGATASVQVGNEVPIITTQRASDSQSGGTTDFLQQVQYRSTGILLSVEPRVYSGNRIDLTISQELSAAQPNESSEISSPIISNRSLVSQLSLQDGQTAVLGGLIENRFTRNNTGIPFLKDVPILGAPFRNEALTSTRTMLVVLVTPFILDSRDDRQQVVDALVGALNYNFGNMQGRGRTLTPPSEPLEIRPAGGANYLQDPDS